MTAEQIPLNDAPEAPPKNTKTRINVNSLTIILVFVFLLVLVAESVAASSLLSGDGKGEGAKGVNLTKEYEDCIALGKSVAKCNATGTAFAKKSPTSKKCDPYKASRAVGSGETFEQFITYYKMTVDQRNIFIKLNSLSPAYPNTVLYTGQTYCLPSGINVKGMRNATENAGYSASADFGFEVVDINGYEISFNLINMEANDKINVYYWKKPPGAGGWHCQKSLDDVCYEVTYRQGESFQDGYSNSRKIWLGMFKVSRSPVTLVFPEEVSGWNNVYVCMHSLYRSEDDESHDSGQHVPSYHSYCQYVDLHNKITNMIDRLPAATQTGTITPTPTALSTPCGVDYCGNNWGSYLCFPPCPGTRLPAPSNTPCAGYATPCPGTQIPHVLGCVLGVPPAPTNHVDPVYSPIPVGPTCDSWWLTPEGSR